MKKNYFVAAFFSFASFAAQEKKVNFTVSAGTGFPFLAQKQVLIGSGEKEIKLGFNAGVTLGYLLSNNDEIEVGAFYQQNKIKKTSAFYPGIPETVTESNVSLIYAPVNYKYNFENRFFIKGGPILDVDTAEKDFNGHNFSGIGFGVAAGKDFEAGNLLMRVQPYANAHSLLSFNNYNYYIVDLGLQLGLVF